MRRGWALGAGLGLAANACIPEPVLRPRDAAAEVAAIDVTDVPAADGGTDISAAPDIVETGVDAIDAGVDADDVPDAVVVDAPEVFTDHIDVPAMDIGRCDPGFALRAGACAAITSARLMWPMSTQTVTHRRPMLRWALGPEADGARVELCRDRGCAMAVTSFVARGTQGQPTEDLPPGPLFWRAWARSGSAEALRPSATWSIYVPWRSGAVNTAQRDTVDVNGDGYADVVVFAPERRELRVYFGSATGPRPAMVMTDPFISTSVRWTARAGDTNGDGRTDVLVQYEPTSWRLFFGTPSGLSLAASTRIISPRPRDGGTATPTFVTHLGDINGDGFGDLANGSIAVFGRSLLSVLLGSTAGPAPGTMTRDVDAPISFPCALGDLDRDGLEDLFGPGALSGGDGGSLGNVALRGGPDPTMWSPLASLPPGSAFGYFSSGRHDFNGDGEPDVFIRNAFARDRVAVAYGLRGASFDASLTFIGTLGGATSGYDAVDFNGDGRADFAIVVPGGQEVALHFGTSAGLSSNRSVRITSTPTNELDAVVSPGDVNGDGWGDLVGIRLSSSQVGFYLITGRDGATASVPPSPFDELARTHVTEPFSLLE